MKLFRNRWFWIGLGVIVLGVAVAGTLAGKKGKVQQVTLTPAKEKELVQKVKAPGEIEPRTTVKISADISGRVTQLAVSEGDFVKRGQLLLEIDNTRFVSSVRQTQALLSGSRARLSRAEDAMRLEQQAFDRRKALFDRKLLSTQELDQAENALMAARTELASAKEETTRLEAALIGDRDNLAKTTYRAPIDGRIVGLNIEEGEIVVVGTMNNPGTQILSVSDLSRMQVVADVDETDVIDVAVGQKAKITVDALPDTSFEGTVTTVGNSASQTTAGSATGETNFEVEVLFSHTVPEIRPGMTADVEIEVKRMDKALSVPIQAVVVRQPEDLEKRGTKKKPEGGAKKEAATNAAASAPEEDLDPAERKKREKTGVFILVDGKAEFREVTTGISSETDIAVVAGGLKPADKVVTGPYKVLRDLRPGDAIELQKKGKGGKPGGGR